MSLVLSETPKTGFVVTSSRPICKLLSSIKTRPYSALDLRRWCTSPIHAKFKYKEMKNVGVTDYTNQITSEHFVWENV